MSGKAELLMFILFGIETIFLHFTSLSTAELHPELLTLLSLYARHK